MSRNRTRTTPSTTPAQVPAQPQPVNLPFTIAGLDLGLLETPVKDKPERKYHCFRLGDTENNGYGAAIPALSEALPSTIVVDGQTITLVVGMSPDTKALRKDGKTVKDDDGKTVMVTIPEEKRYPQAKYTGDHAFPSLKGFDGPDDAGLRRVHATISATQGGKTWNITVSVNRIPSVSPEERQAKAIDKATANLASLMAMFNVQAQTDVA